MSLQAKMEGAMIPPKQIDVAKAMVNYSFEIRWKSIDKKS